MNFSLASTSMVGVKKVFLIDDDETFIFIARSSINKLDLDIDIETFPDGERAINHLKLNANKEDQIPELIFVDINMPYLNGWGFIEEFLLLKPKLKKDVLIYLISSSDSLSEMDRVGEMRGLIDFRIKPITKFNFQHIIESYPMQTSNLKLA